MVILLLMMGTLTTMKNSKLNAIVFSDVHLYHDKTKTEYIIENLYRAFPRTEKLRDVDIIFITGDLFDHEVFMPNPDVQHVFNFIYYLFNICSTYDIVLRVLEGTPSHDWKQAKAMTMVNENLPIPIDFKHVMTLSIEHMDRFGIDVLYVPDEWGNSCSDTFLEVQQLLDENNLEKVDLAMMHGCFNYQFPVNLVGKPDVHDEKSYLDITRYLIFIGHYHTPSIYERIHVPGSFDRLKHGEEEDKGHLEFTIYDTGAYNVDFVKNENAMVYKTLDLSDTPVSECIRHIHRLIPDETKECYIRILANKEDAIYSGLNELRLTFPNIRFSVSLKDKSKIKDKMVSETQDIVRPNTLSLDNIVDLMRVRLIENHPEHADSYLELLKEIMNE